VVWENVPGILSIEGGRVFGTFLAGLAKLGYGFAYRILDAQHFGVPQQRRRVFVVGYLGDWRRAAAVLFERESLCGNPPPSRGARENITETISARTCRSVGVQDAANGHMIPSTGNVAYCLNAGGMGRIDYETETLITHSLKAEGFDASEDGTGRGIPLIARSLRGQANCSHREDSDNIIAFNGRMDPVNGEIPGSLDSKSTQCVMKNGVRRLTPLECERLQGFADGKTKIDSKTADGPRYKALGNSIAVPVIRWIGERMKMVDATL